MGGSGKQADNLISGNAGIQGLKGGAQVAQDPALMQAMMKYSQGGQSLQDAISSVMHSSGSRVADLENQQRALAQKIKDLGPIDSFQKSQQAQALKSQIDQLGAQGDAARADEKMNTARENEFFTNPLTGTKAATEQVQNNPMLSGMFGKGGMEDQLLDEQKDLASKGYSLKPEDNEAYGQASDNIARMFGSQEQGLSQALAARGLAAAPSGAAGAGFSGLMGNKFEQLAGQQRAIAQQRMQMNLQRLNSVRQFAMQGNQLGQQAINSQYDRNMQGVQNYQQSLKDAANAGAMEQGQANTGFEQQQETKGPSFGDVLGGIAGMGLGAATGGLGTGFGSTLGKSLAGGSKKQPKYDFSGADGLGGGIKEY